jgi:hypothetical protein
MSEDALRQIVRRELSPFGKLIRIENMVNAGTPDINYLIRRYPKVEPACGWLELKHEDRWPTRRTTVFRCASLTREQVDWQTHWALAGGRVWTLIQVHRDYLLVDHLTLGALFALQLHPPDLRRMAKVQGVGSLPTAEIVKCLTA